MKRLMILFVALAGVLAVSCNKELALSSGEIADEEHTLTIRVVTDGVKTRAFSSDDVPITDGLHRLDLYVFHEDEPLLDEHITLTPNPTGITTYSFKEKKGERIGVIAIGNLHEDTAKLLEGKTLTQMKNYSNPEAWIVLSANNYDKDRIVMVGANSYSFSKDGEVNIELRRLMYRIDIGKITVAPNNHKLLGKEIFLKNIALTNICNYFVPIYSNSIGHFYTWYLFFGNEINFTNAFGKVERGFRHFVNGPIGNDGNGSFAMDGPGILNGSFPYIINNNYKKDQGVLNVDAKSILKDITHHEYDITKNEGLIVSDGNMEASNSLVVDKCFYGFMGKGIVNEYSIVSEYNDQNINPKLVIELVIDGESWFYPIPIIHPQPNTVYKIDQIIIKDYGSKYSNFSQIKYCVDYNITIDPWSEVYVENINLGIDPFTGEPVNLYE